MKPEPLRIALVLYLAAAACGPTSNTDTGQASSSTAVVSAGTTSSTSGTTGVVDPSTTSTTTSTSDTGAPTSSGGNTFIVTPDGGGTSDYTCDVFKQDCKRGQKCTAWAEDGGGAWNATRCVEVTGSKVPGDVCMTEGGGVSGIDDCEAGAMCWDVTAENMGICVALCRGTPEAPTCDAEFACALFNEGVLNLCLPACLRPARSGLRRRRPVRPQRR